MRVVLAILLVSLPALESQGDPRSTIARVKPVTAERCAILEYGYYVPSSPPIRYSDPSSATGERFEIDEVEFTRQTKVIARELGKGFGIRYRLRSIPRNKDVDVRWKVTFPKPGIRGSDSWEHGLREQTADGTFTHHLLYDFHYAWEMVPGTWTFSVTVDGQPACGFQFTVR